MTAQFRALIARCAAFGWLLFPIGGHAGQSGQFCWAVGSLDRTIYHAAIENREDRSQSFRDFLYISGIEITDHHCVRSPVAIHRSFRRAMIQFWQAAELDVVDTNFLSDLDG